MATGTTSSHSRGEAAEKSEVGTGRGLRVGHRVWVREHRTGTIRKARGLKRACN